MKTNKFYDNDLVFNHSKHQYIYRGQQCVSVTQLIKSYCKPFDSLANATRMAARDGSSADAILSKWEEKGRVASSRGTYVHSKAEYMAHELRLLRSVSMKLPHDRDKECLMKIKALYKWYADHLEMGYGYIEPEVRIVHPGYLIAGTIDLVCESYEGVNAIIDYKTNEEISLVGFNNMLPPFQRGKLKLSDCSYCIYALQLNLYRRILAEKYRWFADKMVLVHLESSGNYVEYNVRQMDEHVDAMLKIHSQDEWEVQQALGGEEQC